MRLDVIIGNPPYNNGMHLDFINRGHDFSTSFCSMIVPANWLYFNNNKKSSAESTTNSQLRDKISPYLKQIVFYKHTTDVFEIKIVGGLIYFLDDHKQHQDCILINRSSRFKSLNSVGQVKLTGVYTLLNIVNDILDSMGHYKKIDRPGLDHRYIVAAKSEYLSNDVYYATYMFTPLYIIDTTVESLGEWMVPFAQFDSIDEARSFFSYINRCLTKLFIDCGNVLYTRFARDTSIWDLVPDPGPFDHIFTDEELYSKYNIPLQLQEDLGRLYKCRPDVLMLPDHNK